MQLCLKVEGKYTQFPSITQLKANIISKSNKNNKPTNHFQLVCR